LLPCFHGEISNALIENTFDIITKRKSLNEKMFWYSVTVYNKKLAKYIIAVFEKSCNNILSVFSTYIKTGFCAIGIKTEIELSFIKLFTFTNVKKLFHM